MIEPQTPEEERIVFELVWGDHPELATLGDVRRAAEVAITKHRAEKAAQDVSDKAAYQAWAKEQDAKIAAGCHCGQADSFNVIPRTLRRNCPLHKDDVR